MRDLFVRRWRNARLVHPRHPRRQRGLKNVIGGLTVPEELLENKRVITKDIYERGLGSIFLTYNQTVSNRPRRC